MRIGKLHLHWGAPPRRRRYEAANMNRLTADWVFGASSSNREIQGGLKVIRERARELERNNDYGRRYLQLVEDNIVGRGFALRVEGDTDNRVRDGFNAWARTADITGRLSWPDMQRLVVRTVARDGEAIAQTIMGRFADGMALQIMEADYIDEAYNSIPPHSPRIVQGVEIDANGRPIAYHCLTEHPGDTASIRATRKRIPASEMIHVARIERPGQVRAVSWVASCMQALKMLYGYQEAELVASRAAACKMGFFKSPPGEGGFHGDDEQNGAKITEMQAGSFQELSSGQDFVPFDPTHPTTQYGVFVKDILRQLSGGLGVAYNNFANDLDGVSYSSIRSGSIEEREHWIVLQEWFAHAFLSQVFSRWLDMAGTTGAAGLTTATAESFRGKDRWTGRRWPWVDPAADIAAKKEEIALGLVAPSQIAAERGDDYAQVQVQIAADNSTRADNSLQAVSAIADKSGAVSDTALNGAQIDSMVTVIVEAAAGRLPKAAVGPILAASFPTLDKSEIAAIVKPLTAFEPQAAPETPAAIGEPKP